MPPATWVNQNLGNEHGPPWGIASIAMPVCVSCTCGETDTLTKFCAYTSSPVEAVSGYGRYIESTGSMEQFHLRHISITIYVLFFSQKVTAWKQFSSRIWHIWTVQRQTWDTNPVLPTDCTNKSISWYQTAVQYQQLSHAYKVIPLQARYGPESG